MTAKRPTHDRFICDLDIELDTGRTRIAGQVRDIHEHGLCCVASDPIQAGTAVTAYLRLVLEWGMSEPIGVLGQTMWLTPTEGKYQIGVAFSPMPQDAAQRFDLLLKVLFGQISLPSPTAG